MQIKMDLDEFNTFIIMYITMILTSKIDHKSGLLSKVRKNPAAKLLVEERETLLKNKKWDSKMDMGFNVKLKQIFPDFDVKGMELFDEIVDVLKGRNISSVLLQSYVKQNPKMKLYIRRFLKNIEDNDTNDIRLGI